MQLHKMCLDVAQAMDYLHKFNPLIIHRPQRGQGEREPGAGGREPRRVRVTCQRSCLERCLS